MLFYPKSAIRIPYFAIRIHLDLFIIVNWLLIFPLFTEKNMSFTDMFFGWIGKPEGAKHAISAGAKSSAKPKAKKGPPPPVSSSFL